MLAGAVAVVAPLANIKAAHANLDAIAALLGSGKTVGHRLAARVVRLGSIKAPLDRLDVDAADQVHQIFSPLSLYLPSFDSYSRDFNFNHASLARLMQVILTYCCVF